MPERFFCTKPSSQDGGGNRDDEPAAPLVVYREVAHDFLGEVPGQDERVLRLAFQEHRVWHNRNAAPRSHRSHLERILFREEREERAIDAAVIEERIAFGRSADAR